MLGCWPSGWASCLVPQPWRIGNRLPCIVDKKKALPNLIHRLFARPSTSSCGAIVIIERGSIDSLTLPRSTASFLHILGLLNGSVGSLLNFLLPLCSRSSRKPVLESGVAGCSLRFLSCWAEGLKPEARLFDAVEDAAHVESNAVVIDALLKTLARLCSH